MIKNLLDRLKKGGNDASFDSVADIQKPSKPGMPMQAAAPIAAPVMIQRPAPQSISVQAPAAIQEPSAPATASAVPKPVHHAFRREAPPKPLNFDYSELLKEEKTFESGVIIELGAGISLNVPIKKKMELDEFLRIADKVKNLEKLEIVTTEMKG